MITMTNVYFAEAIKLGHGNGDRLGYHGGHAPTLDLLPRFTLMQMSSITCTLIPYLLSTSNWLGSYKLA